MDPPPVQYVATSDGYSIAYTVTGKGPALLYVPSAFHHLGVMWHEGSSVARWMEALATHFRIVNFDPRGQGLSQRGLPKSLELEDYLHDIDAVVERARLDRFIVYSESHLGVHYAVRHAQRVEALVLWNQRVVTQTFGRFSLPPADQNWEGYVDFLARVLLTWEAPNFARRMVRDSLTVEDWMLRSRAQHGSSVADLAGTLQVPVLLLAASAGAYPFGLEEENKRLAALIPNARLALFDEPSAGISAPEGQLPPALTTIEAFVRDVASARNELAGAQTVATATLSVRELEVLRLIAAGKSNQQIADELVISFNTVQRHVGNILAKTGLANRTEAAVYARDRGLI